MIRLFALLLTFYAFNSNAQTGYFSAGGVSIVNNGFNPGFTFGGGYRPKNVSFGFCTEFYGLKSGDQKFSVASLDLRAYLQTSKIAPYFGIQPGIVLYDKTINDISMKGNLAGSVTLGLDATFKEDRPGLNLFIGYQYISFKVNKVDNISDSYFKSGITIFLN
jgi:hypothetical protein